MTGLDVKTNKIMEVCCVITNNDLEVLATGPEMIVHHPQSTLDAMDEWCLETHAKVRIIKTNIYNLLIPFPPSEQTGMSEACLRSTDTVEQVEDKLFNFLQAHMGPRECPLAGNTIYMDRLFLSEYMPRVNEFLHYRLIDVSTCKELCKRWNPTLSAQAPKKRFVHRGLEDIMESIEELKYYRQFMFANNNE